MPAFTIFQSDKKRYKNLNEHDKKQISKIIKIKPRNTLEIVNAYIQITKSATTDNSNKNFLYCNNIQLALQTVSRNNFEVTKTHKTAKIACCTVGGVLKTTQRNHRDEMYTRINTEIRDVFYLLLQERMIKQLGRCGSLLWVRVKAPATNITT